MFVGVDACAVSDALDALGFASPHHRLRPLWEGARVAGPIITTALAAGSAPAGTPKVHLGVRAILRARPGGVILMANEGRVEMGGWGGLLTRAARQRGVAGVIVDGACRDLDEAREAAFPVFGLGSTPRTARARIHEVSVGEPVTVAGCTVRTGDWVVADGSGVVFVPAEHAAEVSAKAGELALGEATMIERLASGEDLADIFGVAYEDMLVRPAGEK
jgi:regulator of RNase E activity RraA